MNIQLSWSYKPPASWNPISYSRKNPDGNERKILESQMEVRAPKSCFSERIPKELIEFSRQQQEAVDALLSARKAELNEAQEHAVKRAVTPVFSPEVTVSNARLPAQMHLLVFAEQQKKKLGHLPPSRQY